MLKITREILQYQEIAFHKVKFSLTNSKAETIKCGTAEYSIPMAVRDKSFVRELSLHILILSMK